MIDRLVLKGNNRIIVPKKLRKNALNKLHISHLGTSKTILRARICVFWPGINGDNKELCKNCEICNKFSTRQPSESLKNDLVCTKPWDTLACDLFEFQGKLFLIIVDMYPKLACMEAVVDHTADKTILAILNIFIKLGIPYKIWCGRGSNFLSISFHKFCSNLDIVLEFSSSYHHSSNPQERAVWTYKNIMKKCADVKLGNSAWSIGLIEYCCTPISYHCPVQQKFWIHAFTKVINLSCVLLLGLSQSLMKLLKGRKKRNFTMIDLFQISQL